MREPCPCTLERAPRHILDPFDRIRWALGHLRNVDKDCTRDYPFEASAAYRTGYHNRGVVLSATTSIERAAAVAESLL